MANKLTIGQKGATRGQDTNGSPQAEFITGRDITDQRHRDFAIKPSSNLEPGASPDLRESVGTVTYRFAQIQQREIPMKRLISRAMYHPIIAVSALYLADVMHHVDYSVAGAVLALAAKTISRVLSLCNKG